MNACSPPGRWGPRQAVRLVWALADPDLDDAQPLVWTLEADTTHELALLTDPADAQPGGYSASGLPAFGSFDSQLGVSTLAPVCADEGVYSVAYDVSASQGAASLQVDFEVVCPVALSGLDFENDGLVSAIQKLSGGLHRGPLEKQLGYSNRYIEPFHHLRSPGSA